LSWFPSIVVVVFDVDVLHLIVVVVISFIVCLHWFKIVDIDLLTVVVVINNYVSLRRFYLAVISVADILKRPPTTTTRLKKQENSYQPKSKIDHGNDEIDQQ
jgi:hypothetical protein